MAKRGENIYKRKDGRWEGRYAKGRKSDGRLLYGYVYSHKYQICREKLFQARTKYTHMQKAYETCGTGAVSDFMDYWLFRIVQPYVRASTFDNYVTILKKWIAPALGKKKLNGLIREDVQNFIGNLSRHGLSAGTVHNIYRVLSAAMKKGEEYGYLYGNPCAGIRLPKLEKKEARLLSLSEQKLLEQAAKGDRNGFAVLLAVYTGLRIGEICALKWEDVDLVEGTLHVSRTIRRVRCPIPGGTAKTMLMTGSAKSSHSIRIIPLPAGILKMFREHKKRSLDHHVFSCRGHSLEPRVLQYRFKALLKKAGLGEVNFHALRHTFATRCMELCVDIRTLSELLGHASAKMTLDLYGHSRMEQKRASMKALNRLLLRSV